MNKLALLFVLLLSFNTFAGSCDSRGCKGKVTNLYINEAGKVLIGMDGDERAANCNPSANVYLTLAPEHKAFDVIYSTLLTYKTLGKEVYLRIQNNSNGCLISYLRVE